MRSIAFLGVALSLLLGAAAASQPAVAGGDCCYYGGADVYVHHHVYYPPRRVKHVYHVHRPGPTHVHVIEYAGPYVGTYYWRPRYYYRWRGYDRGW